ncbi:hypothetical protein P7C70_g4510, partial [Phenoliferia sp. Uapishka_3]
MTCLWQPESIDSYPTSNVLFLFPNSPHPPRTLWGKSKVLVKQSEYFKSLFEGGFAESEGISVPAIPCNLEPHEVATHFHPEESEDDTDDAAGRWSPAQPAKIYRVVVRDTPFKVYRALLCYLATGHISFSRLRSNPLRSKATELVMRHMSGRRASGRALSSNTFDLSTPKRVGPNAARHTPLTWRDLVSSSATSIATPGITRLPPGSSRTPNTNLQASTSTASPSSASSLGYSFWDTEITRGTSLDSRYNDAATARPPIGSPDPVSPKSIYLLADRLIIPQLKELALESFQSQLHARNVVEELLSEAVDCCPELREAAMEVAQEHWSTIVQGVEFKKVRERAAAGELTPSQMTALLDISIRLGGGM